MSTHEIVMLALVMLLPAVIGFAGGMVWMRFQYIERMRRDHHLINRLVRRVNGCN